MKPIKLSLVVAACQSNQGIGINGTLPWRIPGDLAFFKKITTESLNKPNAVIMGRKTWESIPLKFRPLPRRVNIVLSSTVESMPPTVHLVRSFDDAMNLVTSLDLENVFVIGGATVYKMALQSSFCYRIYLTQVLKDFDCDVFLPQFDSNLFQPIQLPDMPSEIQTDGEISYKFTVYERKPSIILADDCLSVSDVLSECLQRQSLVNQPLVSICVAMDLNRGFGHNGSLPWPKIKKDFDQFISIVSNTINPDKKSVVIKARKTWEGTSKEEDEAFKSTIRIVVSTTMSNPPSNVDYIVKSFDEALHVAIKLWSDGIAEKIWVLGGKEIYQASIDSPSCQLIYMTRILDSFDSDVFFPEFENKFKLRGKEGEELDKESGITIQRVIYERI